MAMAPQGQAEHEHDHQHGIWSEPNSSHTDPGAVGTSNIATNRWEPAYSGAGDYIITIVIILVFSVTTIALILSFDLASYLLGRRRRARHGHVGSSSGEAHPPPPAPPPPLPPPPPLVYSSASTKLAGAAVECTICLAEFADGDAIRVMPACRHGFHEPCIERWLAGGRRSSCPTCCAPAAVASGAAAAAQPDEAAASSS